LAANPFFLDRMQRCLLISMVLLLSMQLQAQWLAVVSNTTESIADLYFKDSLHGFMVTAEGTVSRTTDGGSLWQMLFQDAVLYADQHLVATNDSVFCFATDFQGQYHRVSFPLGGGNHVDVILPYFIAKPQFFGQKIWYLRSDIGLATYDHGQNDTLLPGITPDDLHAAGSQVSVTTATTVHVSDNFGQTWESGTFNNSELSSYPYTCFSSGDTLLATISYPTILFHSTDRGVTWQHTGTIPALKFYYVNASTLFGLDLYAVNGRIYRSADRGQSFTTDSLDRPVHGIYNYKDQMSFAYGPGGAIYKRDHPGAWLETIQMTAFGKIKVSPNPATEKLELTLPDHLRIDTILLVDARGTIVRRYPSHERLLKTAGLPKGMYLLRMSTGEGQFTQKIELQ